VPGLQEAFATSATTWQGCVAAAMDLPDTLPASLDELFQKSGAASAMADGSLDLTSWVQSVVDQNFT
jgi:thiamine monophosphate kinase